MDVMQDVYDISLRPAQIEWSERAHDILMKNHGYIDTSPMGRGKTVITLYLAKRLGFRLLIICPTTVKSVWYEQAAKYGVEIIDAISYQSLRSTNGHQPSNGLLTREDYRTPEGHKKVSFYPTEYCKELVESGILIVLDEVQFIKNNSDQYKACHALLRTIVTGGGLSRFALLSGTPIDKTEQSINLLRLLGYINRPRLYFIHPANGQVIFEGLEDLINACNYMDPVTTAQVLADFPKITKSNASELCYELLVEVVKKTISGSMPPLNIEGFVLDEKDGYYNMGEAYEMATKAVQSLNKATNFRGDAVQHNINYGEISKAMLNIEISKINLFVRLASETLHNVPNSKVILSFNYVTNTLDVAAELLQEYNPLLLTGKVPINKRGQIIDSFNNDPNYRLLLMNTVVGGVGISLHDTVGDSPRYMFISPSYRLLDIMQARSRIWRDGVLSDATVRMVYGKDLAKETKILYALAKKTAVLKGVLAEDVVSETKFPGEYESYIEP